MQNKIAINLVNVGNTQNSYLRCYGAGEEVRLTDNDSGESTRWYINPLYTPNLGHSIYSAGRGSTSTYVYSIEPDDYSATVSAEARVRKYEAKSTYQLQTTTVRHCRTVVVMILGWTVL